MKTFSGSITRSSNGNNHILDLTEDLRRLVEESGVRVGQAVVLVDFDTRPREPAVVVTILGE
ncbi:MAG: hypothetical protein NT105_16955 [Verrucomicrobia bacterium]|nr:hypothetical protein [Verrucomicrobiota bacterium]